MFDKIAEFLRDTGNTRKIRYMGFSMATLGMVAGIGAAIVAGVIGSGGVGGCAAGMIVLSFILLPVTDINFPKKRGYY